MIEETQFFHDIAKRCLDFVAGQVDTVTVTMSKKVTGDIATNIDIETEKLIVDEINNRFLGDAILAEEGFSDTAIENGRMWVIDPICGTTNISRGVRTFCSNIALLVDKKIVAALVVDYDREEYVWSVGDGVYVGEQQLKNPELNQHKVIDVDTGCIFKSPDKQDEYTRILTNILHRSDWMTQSFGTSLTAMYVATGRFDGNMRYLFGPWDVCASVFLVREMGGYAVNFRGDDWTVFDKRLILARDEETRNRLLGCVQQNSI